MNWPQLLALVALPIFVPAINWWLERDKAREDREIAEWEAEQEAKRKKDYYALASLQPPPLLGMDGGSRGGAAGNGGGADDPR